MTTTLGPGTPFELLLERDVEAAAVGGLSLPARFQEVYGGDWVIPIDDAGCYRYSCFVMSHDGKVSFNVPGHEGGGDISGFNVHDQWIMGLMRARADAVVVGANTLRTESEHKWTHQYIFPADTVAFEELRSAENRIGPPLQVFLTRTGDVPTSAAIYDDPELTVVFATTTSGAERISQVLPRSAGVQIIEAGDDDLDVETVFQTLSSDFDVRTVLCEGGPRVYASLLTAGQIDDEFLTLSPVIVGGSAKTHRPGLFDGVAFDPGNSLRRELVSLRVADEHLFVRARYSATP